METYKHWAEDLQVGDRVLATIRHKTNGKLNRHNVNIVVISNDAVNQEIKGLDNEKGIWLFIPYNELKPIIADATN